MEENGSAKSGAKSTNNPDFPCLESGRVKMQAIDCEKYVEMLKNYHLYLQRASKIFEIVKSTFKLLVIHLTRLLKIFQVAFN